MMTSKERFMAVINGKKPDKIPVFPLLMGFSAKRYGITYATFAKDGIAFAEAQLSVYEKFGLDAITACSDAFRITGDLGGDLIFPDNGPPYLGAPLVKNESDFNALVKPDVHDGKTRMADRVLGVSEMAKAVGNECMVVGWVDMPFAEACSICGVSEFMMMLYDNPTLAHKILRFLTDIVIEFGVAQLKAGAPTVGAGDAAASLISPELFREFALPYEKMVCDAVHKEGGAVKLHICGNTTQLIGEMIKSNADLFNVDHLASLSYAKEMYDAAGKAFKGNIDPVEHMLQATPEKCILKVKECIEIAGDSSFMVSAGCEIPAAVSDEVFKAFCDARDL
ncbi:MAG: uroporphyrinogen decarboxylase family protein [Firmicutes bacterium]|nr:uroporphyrinogen decarboxylase family protein [Bacillota bacterium]